jgi:hypothetical protein
MGCRIAQEPPSPQARPWAAARIGGHGVRTARWYLWVDDQLLHLRKAGRLKKRTSASTWTGNGTSTTSALSRRLSGSHTPTSIGFSKSRCLWMPPFAAACRATSGPATIVGDRFAQTLYDHIPEKRRLKLASIYFASPGWMELAGYVPVLAALAWVTKLWIKNLDQTFDLFKKVDEYFSKRKLRDLRDKGSIKEIDGKFVDEAREFALDMGASLDSMTKRSTT